jgi:hypothetical protein
MVVRAQQRWHPVQHHRPPPWACRSPRASAPRPPAAGRAAAAAGPRRARRAPSREARASDHQAAAERRGCAGLPASRVLRLRRMWTGFRGDSVGGCRLPVACCVLSPQVSALSLDSGLGLGLWIQTTVTKPVTF